jgi:hypothetical protein
VQTIETVRLFDANIAQEILDIAHKWESDIDMKFSAEKCLVLS